MAADVIACTGRALRVFRVISLSLLSLEALRGQGSKERSCEDSSICTVGQAGMPQQAPRMEPRDFALPSTHNASCIESSPSKVAHPAVPHDTVAGTTQEQQAPSLSLVMSVLQHRLRQ